VPVVVPLPAFALRAVETDICVTYSQTPQREGTDRAEGAPERSQGTEEGTQRTGKGPQGAEKGTKGTREGPQEGTEERTEGTGQRPEKGTKGTGEEGTGQRPEKGTEKRTEKRVEGTGEREGTEKAGEGIEGTQAGAEGHLSSQRREERLALASFVSLSLVLAFAQAVSRASVVDCSKAERATPTRHTSVRNLDPAAPSSSSQKPKAIHLFISYIAFRTNIIISF
jgi:hypothetical protein